MSVLREHPKDDRGRVTAGIPALSPERRHDITERQLKRVYHDSLVAGYKRNEEVATDDDGDITVTNWDQIVGIPLEGTRIIGRLKKLNSKLWFERANADPSKTGVYILQNDLMGGQEKKFLIGMETGINPEYSLRVLDNEGKPKAILSGWRRVLMRLIRINVITESGAFSLFGPPSRQSENWARFTQ